MLTGSLSNAVTVPYRQRVVLVTCEFQTEAAAVSCEKYLNSRSGRAFAKRHFATVGDQR